MKKTYIKILLDLLCYSLSIFYMLKFNNTILNISMEKLYFHNFIFCNVQIPIHRMLIFNGKSSPPKKCQNILNFFLNRCIITIIIASNLCKNTLKMYRCNHS